MYTKSIREYLDVARENRSIVIDRTDELVEFDILGYHPSVALVPTSLRGRPEEDGEATWTYLIHEIFPELSNYSVVFEGVEDDLKTPLWHCMILEMQCLNPNFIVGFTSVLYHALMRSPARDHSFIENVRYDVISEMGLWPARDCMTDRFTAGIMSLVNDVIYIKGEEEVIKRNGVPSDVMIQIRDEAAMERISQGII